MATIGQIASGRDIGKKGPRKLFVWSACVDCGKERWVMCIGGKPLSPRCCSCASKEQTHQRGENAPAWKGGRMKNGAGYILLLLQPDDFFYPMTNNHGYVREHRLVMAKFLNRCLLPWEIVHHLNGLRTDNRIENLQFLPHHRFHISDSILKKRIAELEKRVTLLEAENTLLKEEK